jgi:hypothetical protein
MLRYKAKMMEAAEAGLTEQQRQACNKTDQQKPFMQVLKPVGAAARKLPWAERKLKREQQAEQLQRRIEEIAGQVHADGGTLYLKVDQLEALVKQQAQALEQQAQVQQAPQAQLLAVLQQLLEQQFHSDLSGSVYGSEMGQLSRRSTLLVMSSIEQQQQQQQQGVATPVINRQPSDEEPRLQGPRLEPMQQFLGTRGGGAK